MSIHLSRQLYDEMVAHSRHSLPNEACGLLIREASFSPSDELHIHSFIPLRNYAAHPTRQFTINPIDMLPYLTDIRSTIVGIFHSHPTAAPIPSAEDLLTLWHTIPTYWITFPATRGESRPPGLFPKKNHHYRISQTFVCHRSMMA